VVDPGVGSARRGIAVDAGEHRFVGPDNGIFGYIYAREPAARVFHLTNEEFFRSSVSSTFHGRDVFAPVAAALARGVAPAELGPEIADFVRLDPPRPGRTEDDAFSGTVLHVDRFGNLVTSFTREHLPDEAAARGFRLSVNGREVRALRRFYAEAGAGGEPFAIWGSAGFLEVSANRASAARLLGARPGDAVVLSLI
jgi:S-adenosylmethionine hydrolase